MPTPHPTERQRETKQLFLLSFGRFQLSLNFIFPFLFNATDLFSKVRRDVVVFITYYDCLILTLNISSISMQSAKSKTYKSRSSKSSKSMRLFAKSGKSKGSKSSNDADDAWGGAINAVSYLEYTPIGSGNKSSGPSLNGVRTWSAVTAVILLGSFWML